MTGRRRARYGRYAREWDGRIYVFTSLRRARDLDTKHASGTLTVPECARLLGFVPRGDEVVKFSVTVGVIHHSPPPVPAYASE